MENRPSKKQRELLSFIDGFIKGHGYGPSYREVMRALDYKSVSTVATHIDGLVTKGFLIKRDHSARSLEVVGDGTSSQLKPIAKEESASQQIVKKFDALAKEDSANKDLETLVETLRILGEDQVYIELKKRLDSFRKAA